MIVEVTSNVVGLTIAIVLAQKGFGVYSLVAQSLVQAILTTMFFFKLSSLKVNFSNYHIKEEDKKGLLNFSGYLFLFNFLNYFSKNLDVMLVGKFFNTVILGTYSVANRVMLFPIQNITFVVTRALLPNLMNKIKNKSEVRENYFNIVFCILSLSAPLMMGLMVLSKNFVNVFFGNRWPDLNSILFWLAPTAIIQSVLSISGAILTAYGKTKLFFKLGLFSSILMAVFYLIGVNFGIVSFVKFYFLANIINAFVVLYCMAVLLEFEFFKLIVNIVRSILPAVLMALFLFFILPYIDFLSIHFELITAILIGFSFYSFCFYLFNISKINGFVKLIFKKIRV